MKLNFDQEKRSSLIENIGKLLKKVYFKSKDKKLNYKFLNEKALLYFADSVDKNIGIFGVINFKERK